MTRKVCYITGTRADFGLMTPVLRAIETAPDLALSIAATGMHLSERYGLTVRDIEKEGFPIAARIPVKLEQADGAAMARNIGTMLTGFVDYLAQAKPDVVLLLGDRGEMLAGALAAVHLNIVVAHVHGGERSGTVDEPIRHAISKLSHYHFVATDAARERLIRMGERPDSVHVTGAPGLDGLETLAATPRAELAREAGLDPAEPIALLVFHPVLQDAEHAGDEAALILDALTARGIQTVALLPNSDAGSDRIRAVLEQRAGRAGVHVVTHLARDRFVSWMAQADFMIGNSSAGIIEAATFGTPVVNVGGRQNLRERNRNVADVEIAAEALGAAIDRARAQGRHARENIYGDGHASERIVALLRSVPLGRSVLVKVNAY